MRFYGSPIGVSRTSHRGSPGRAQAGPLGPAGSPRRSASPAAGRRSRAEPEQGGPGCPGSRQAGTAPGSSPAHTPSRGGGGGESLDDDDDASSPSTPPPPSPDHTHPLPCTQVLLLSGPCPSRREQRPCEVRRVSGPAHTGLKLTQSFQGPELPLSTRLVSTGPLTQHPTEPPPLALEARSPEDRWLRQSRLHTPGDMGWAWPQALDCSWAAGVKGPAFSP